MTLYPFFKYNFKEIDKNWYYKDKIENLLIYIYNMKGLVEESEGKCLSIPLFGSFKN